MATKTAKDYPITFGYNAQYPVYLWPLVGRYHKGNDRVMPVGTPVKINKTVIGLSGNSGLSTGPHLHNSKYVSTIRNFLGFPRKYYKPDKEFTVKGRVVYAGWLGTAGRCVVIKELRTDDKRVFRMYAHLSSIKVKKNDWV